MASPELIFARSFLSLRIFTQSLIILVCCIVIACLRLSPTSSHRKHSVVLGVCNYTWYYDVVVVAAFSCAGIFFSALCIALCCLMVFHNRNGVASSSPLHHCNYESSLLIYRNWVTFLPNWLPPSSILLIGFVNGEIFLLFCLNIYPIRFVRILYFKSLLC